MAIVYSTYIDRLGQKNSKRFYCKAGTETVPKYEYQIVDGIKQLVNCGEKDLNAEIQSYAECTDINNIVNRFLNGETDLLNVKNGIYADVSEFPTNYAEMFSRVQKCENIFNSLPVDIRNEFDNSYYKFWDEFGTERFDKVFEKYNNSNYQNDNGIDKPSVSAVSDEKKGVTNAE